MRWCFIWCFRILHSGLPVGVTKICLDVGEHGMNQSKMHSIWILRSLRIKGVHSQWQSCVMSKKSWACFWVRLLSGPPLRAPSTWNSAHCSCAVSDLGGSQGPQENLQWGVNVTFCKKTQGVWRSENLHSLFYADTLAACSFTCWSSICECVFTHFSLWEAPEIPVNKARFLTTSNAPAALACLCDNEPDSLTKPKCTSAKWEFLNCI